MSSILDALNKLEEEKAVAEEIDERDLDQKTAERELIGHSAWTGWVHLRVTPGVVVIGVLVFSAVLIVASVGTSLYLIRTQASPAPPPASAAFEQASVVPLQSAPQPSPPVEEAPVVTTDVDDMPRPAPQETEQPAPVEPDEEENVSEVVPAVSLPTDEVGEAVVSQSATELIEEADPVPTPRAPTVKADSSPKSPSPESAAEPLAVDSTPSESVRVVEEAKPQETKPARTVVAKADRGSDRETGPLNVGQSAPIVPQGGFASASFLDEERPGDDSVVVDLASLPVVSHTDKIRLGLENVVINVTGPATKNRPRASAIINLQKVYVGETIPKTKAKLIGTDAYGIGIEVRGERYFLPKDR